MRLFSRFILFVARMRTFKLTFSMARMRRGCPSTPECPSVPPQDILLPDLGEVTDSHRLDRPRSLVSSARGRAPLRHCILSKRTPSNCSQAPIQKTRTHV